jgi:hypothetical protein
VFCSCSQEVVSEQPQRFFVAEIIREKIFLMYDHEIPYCSQVSEHRLFLRTFKWRALWRGLALFGAIAGAQVTNFSEKLAR